MVIGPVIKVDDSVAFYTPEMMMLLKVWVKTLWLAISLYNMKNPYLRKGEEGSVDRIKRDMRQYLSHLPENPVRIGVVF